MSFLLMKKLSANVLAVDTKLLLTGSLSPGGPAGVMARSVNGEPGHGHSTLPGCAQTFSRGSLQKDSLHGHFWVNKKTS